jgi:hypothetical protein
LLPGLLHLGIADSNGLLQRLRVLQPSFDQLILEACGFVPLGFQLALVLGEQLVLFSWNPE